MKLLDFPHSASLVTNAPVMLFDGLTTASITLGTWPAGRTGKIKATVSSVAGHTDCAGTLMLGTETLTFIQAGTKTTTVDLTANPAASSANLDCHLHLEVVDTGLAPIMAETLTTIMIRFEPTSKTYQNAQGAWTQSQAYAMVVGSTIGLNSVIRYNSIDYTTKQIEAFNWLDGTELYRILYF